VTTINFKYTVGEQTFPVELEVTPGVWEELDADERVDFLLDAAKEDVYDNITLVEGSIED